MKRYELLSIIKTNLDMDGVDQVIRNIEETIKTMGGNVLNTDKVGRKKLGYDIQKFRDGFYVIFTIEMPENKIVDLRRYLKINDNVLREVLTVLSKAKATC